MICLLVITDGRDGLIERTIASAEANLTGPITRRVIYDDSGDPHRRASLAATFPAFEIIHHPDGRQGFGGAIRTAWRHIVDRGEQHVFHLEDDFTFNRPVDLAALATVLDDNSHLVQLALRRQPWNDQERAAGGIVEQHPDAYTDSTDGKHRWLAHRLFFTTNPSLYRSSLCLQAWPEGFKSEGRFTHQLLTDPAVRFGFWGSRDSGEWCTHIGNERAGVGY